MRNTTEGLAYISDLISPTGCSPLTVAVLGRAYDLDSGTFDLSDVLLASLVGRERRLVRGLAHQVVAEAGMLEAVPHTDGLYRFAPDFAASLDGIWEMLDLAVAEDFPELEDFEVFHVPEGVPLPPMVLPVGEGWLVADRLPFGVGADDAWRFDQVDGLARVHETGVLIPEQVVAFFAAVPVPSVSMLGLGRAAAAGLFQSGVASLTRGEVGKALGLSGDVSADVLCRIRDWGVFDIDTPHGAVEFRLSALGAALLEGYLGNGPQRD